ncbi:hypothetical protein [Pseudoclavibacter sp. 8L]|uniref:hypothetical protein n=1 Tax=Pseudoclavibacter sp. 8L TaxID=2653162 RepID=UPI0012F3AEFC|nr:hypothetical protein [Pseudoclavibacter sp. 8L]VXB74600.1 hypothetical protein PSCLAVI8L_180133 [Pseudoclavibacter sp. 8L]
MPKSRHQRQDWNRKASKQETYDYFVRASVRFTRHFTSYREGEFAAIDDVVALMRTLCGDGLIARAIETFELTDPVLYTSKAPERSATTHLTVGNLPFLIEQSESTQTTLTGWLKSPAAIFTETGGSGGKQRSQRIRSWSDLLAGISNTSGSHASEWIPKWIEETRLVGIDTLNLAGYLVEFAAAVVEHCLADLLTELGEAEHAPNRHPIPIRPVNLAWLHLYLDDQKLMHLEFFGGSHEGTPDGKYTLIRVRQGGLEVGMDLIRSGGRDLLFSIPVRTVS